MNAKILCTWLGTTAWPPEHHVLLGVDPGETDGQRIERQCQERMAKLRCFQLSHPEEATEGMNRVAQAFISLTETLARAACNQASGNGSVFKPAQDAATRDTKPLVTAGSDTEIDWRNTPPPIRAIRPSEPTQQSVPSAKVPPPKLAEVVIYLAQCSTEARQRLGTLPALVERINLTRHDPGLESSRQISEQSQKNLGPPVGRGRFDAAAQQNLCCDRRFPKNPRQSGATGLPRRGHGQAGDDRDSCSNGWTKTSALIWRGIGNGATGSDGPPPFSAQASLRP